MKAVVGIIGLGLIGGSLGLGLRSMKLIDKVCGYDINKQNEQDALNLGLVDEIVSFEEMKKSCNMIFLAVPVEAIVKILQDLKDIPSDTTIVELGSTKRKIIDSCPNEIKANFVAAHPMAGTENSGPKAAFKSLLTGAVVVICDDKIVGENHVKRAVEVLSGVGMRIIFMDPDSHDKHVGIISHLPHAISFSLVNATLKEEDKRNISLLVGGSFGGMARIAKSSPQMWVDIFKQNKDYILKAMQKFKKEFDICENLMKNEKWDELEDWMKMARQIRDIL